MSEAPTNPETGVEAAPAATDDIDTSAFDRMEAPDEDEAEPADGDKPEGEDGEVSDEDKAKAAAAAEEIEFETDDGTKLKVPKALEAHLLRQQDYTKKTQDVAELRRAVEAEKSTLETRAAEIEASRVALPDEHKRVAIIDHTISAVKTQMETPDQHGIALSDIDWPTFRLKAQGNEQMMETYRDYRSRYDAAREALDDLQTERGTAVSDLTSKEQARLEDQRKTADAAGAKAWQDTEAALKDEKTGIPGWSPEKAKELAGIAVTEFGVKPEELQNLADPRFWKIFNAVASERARADKAEAALKLKTTADNHGKAQQTAPAGKVNGSGGSARDPATSRGDGLATPTWMEKRNAQVAKNRA